MLSNPAPRTRALIENIQLFQEYNLKYPSHGYRWLNAKIRLDKGIEMSDQLSLAVFKLLIALYPASIASLFSFPISYPISYPLRF